MLQLFGSGLHPISSGVLQNPSCAAPCRKRRYLSHGAGQQYCGRFSKSRLVRRDRHATEGRCACERPRPAPCRLTNRRRARKHRASAGARVGHQRRVWLRRSVEHSRPRRELGKAGRPSCKATKERLSVIAFAFPWFVPIYPAFRGRPPFLPFARAASALAALRVRPAWLACHERVPNTPASRPGTDRSTSRSSQ